MMPQLGVPDFVNSPREALPPLRRGWKCDTAGWEEGRGELGWVYKTKNNFFK